MPNANNQAERDELSRLKRERQYGRNASEQDGAIHTKSNGNSEQQQQSSRQGRKERPNSGDASGERTEQTGEQRRGSNADNETASDSRFAETIGVGGKRSEPKKEKRKRARPKGSKNKGGFTPQFVERSVSLGFDLAAMIRGPHWKVRKPHDEIGPWAEDAADLLNKIPVRYAESMTSAYSATAVLGGLGMMVFVRYQQDIMLQQQFMPTEEKPQNVTEMRESQKSSESNERAPGGAEPHPASAMFFNDNTPDPVEY